MRHSVFLQDGMKILQTDANNDYRSAVLLEEKDGWICQQELQRCKTTLSFHVQGDSAVKNEIMKAFPKMIQINFEVVSNLQILRWAQWFSSLQVSGKTAQGER